VLQGWTHSSSDGKFVNGSDPLTSSQFVYFLSMAQTTQAFVTVIQPKKRSNTQSKYWYCDPCLILLRRLNGHCENTAWQCVASSFTGIKRQIHVDVFLEAGYTYACIPFCCLASKREECQATFPFRLSVYSLHPAQIKSSPVVSEEFAPVWTAALGLIHRELLSRETKLIYPVSVASLLVCVHGEGSLYFVAINGAMDTYLSVRLTVDLPDGLLVVFGQPEDSFDIPPTSQRLLAVVSSNGKRSSATEFTFRYLSSTVTVESTRTTRARQSATPRQEQRLGSIMALSLNGDLLTNDVDPRAIKSSGGGTIDTYLWIPQLGMV
jgi:hypothetical protein